MDLRSQIASVIKGDVQDDAETLKKFSRDTSIFERKPALVVSPKDADDVSGGPLTDSVVVSFTKYMNAMGEIGRDPDAAVGTGFAVAEPGIYYRDFERETLAKNGTILPPYPASREMCALGGMIADNAGGELTLRYGKMDRYVQELDV